MKRCSSKNLFSLSLLVVLAILLTSSTYAISIYSLTGEDNIDHIMKLPDTIIANVSAGSMPSVYMNDVACSNENNRFICTETVSSSEENFYSLEFAIYNDAAELMELTTEEMVIDNKAPHINSYNAETTPLGVKYSYEIQDEETYNGQCAGIDRIEFYAGSTLLETEELDGSCGVITGEKDIEYDQTANFYIKVYDKLGNNNESEQIELEIVKAIITGFGLEDETTGIPITKISLVNTLIARTVFYVEADSLEGVQVNYSSLVQNPTIQNQYKNLIVPLSSCQRMGNSSFKCGLDNTYINPANATVTLGFDILANENIQSISTYTHTFDIDNEAPNAISLETEHCFEDKCYMKNNENTKIIISFDDTTEQFARRQVFYFLGGVKYQVDTCSNGVCSDFISKQCSAGSLYSKLHVSNSALVATEDDAGNRVPNTIETNFYCDAVTPFDNDLGEGVTYDRETDTDYSEGSSIEIVPNSDYGLIRGGESLTVHAYVFENGPKLNAYANFTSIGGDYQEASCSAYEGSDYLYKCTWSVSLLNEHLQEDIEFEFVDVVNTTYTTSETITILQVEGGNETTPDCINVEATDFMPKKLNRIALDLASTNSIDYPVYAGFETSQKQGSSQGVSCSEIEIYKQEEYPTCMIVLSNGTELPAINFFDISINDPFKYIGESNFINLITSLSPNLQDQYYTLKCNLSFYVASDERVYSQPITSQGEWDIEFTNSAFGNDYRPGQVYTNKLKRLENRQKNTYNQMLNYANMILATASEICGAKNLLNILGPIGLGLKTTGKVLDSANIGVGPVIFNVGELLKKTSKIGSGDEHKVAEKGWMNSVDSFMDKMCGFVTCNLGKYEDDLNDNAWAETWNGWNSGSSLGGEQISNGVTNVFDGNGDNNNRAGTGAFVSDGDGGLKFSMSSLGEGYASAFGEDLTLNLNRPNLYNSLISCISTGCWQGVVYHLNKYRESDCQVMYCIKRNAQYGLGVSSCYQSQRTFVCKQIVGEFFEIPGIRTIKNLADNVNNLVQNFFPKLITTTWSNLACSSEYEASRRNENVKTFSIPHMLLCETPLAIGRILRTKSLSSNAGSFMYPNSPDICAMAMCNKENEKDCETNAGLIGRFLPEFSDKVMTGQDRLGNAEIVARYQTAKRNNGNGFYKTMNAYLGCIDRNDPCANKYGMNLKHDYGLTDMYVPSYDDNGDIQNEPGSETGLSQNGNVNDDKFLGYMFDQFSAVELGTQGTGTTGNVYYDNGGFANRKDYIMTQEFMSYYNTKNTGQQQSENGESLGNLQMKFLTDTRSTTPQMDAARANTLSNIQMTPAEAQAYEQNLVANFPPYLENYAAILVNEQGMTGSWTVIYDPESGKWTLSPEDKLRLIKCLQGGECDNIGSDVKEHINSPEFQQNLKDIKDHDEWLIDRQEWEETIDEILRMIWDDFIGDLGTLSDLAEAWDAEWMQDLSDTMNTYVNSESWKNNICNPIIEANYGDKDPDGSVLDCRDSTCEPVLTMAMEKTPYNWTDEERTDVDNYIYTMVYLLGPVKENFKFNVNFKKVTGGSHCVYQDEVSGECRNLNIATGKVDEKTVAFVSKENYDEVCIKFNRAFPGGGSVSDTEYCRDIVDTQVTPGGAFHTGEPDPTYGLSGAAAGDPENGDTVPVFG